MNFWYFWGQIIVKIILFYLLPVKCINYNRLKDSNSLFKWIQRVYKKKSKISRGMLTSNQKRKLVSYYDDL